jgi:hypothetical protein
MPPRPKMPPMVVAMIVLRALRRVVAVARALVTSSKWVGFMNISSIKQNTIYKQYE